jgi:hypothetical protein
MAVVLCPFKDIYQTNLAAIGFDDRLADHVLDPVIGTFDQDVRLEPADERSTACLRQKKPPCRHPRVH